MKKIKLVEHCNERQVGNKLHYRKDNDKYINSRNPFVPTYKTHKASNKKITND